MNKHGMLLLTEVHDHLNHLKAIPQQGQNVP